MADEELAWHPTLILEWILPSKEDVTSRGSKRMLNVIIDMRLRTISQDRGAALENYTNTKAPSILSLLAGERSECQN